MRWAALVVVVSLGVIGLTEAMHLAVEKGRKAMWVASAKTCWDQNVEYRAKLPAWER